MPKNNHYTLSFQDAKKIVHSYKFKSIREWKNFAKTEKRPLNIPRSPHNVYQNEWKGWGDWLNIKKVRNYYGRISTNRPRGNAKNFLPYAEAKAYVQKLNLKSHKQYREWSRSNRPIMIPGNPDLFYKNQFEGWAEYLGYNLEPTAQQMPDLFVEKTNPQPVEAQIEQPVVLPQLPKLHAISKIVEEIEAEKRAEEIYQRANRLSGFLKEFDELAEKSMQGWRNAYINYLASLAFKHENLKTDLHPTITLFHAVDAAIKNPVTATLMISLETELSRSMWAGHNIGEEKYEGLPVDHAVEMLTSRGWEWYGYEGRCRTLISPLIGLQINIFEIPSENGEYWVVDKIEFDLYPVCL
jgi:hypothetical protein